MSSMSPNTCPRCPRPAHKTRGGRPGRGYVGCFSAGAEPLCVVAHRQSGYKQTSAGSFQTPAANRVVRLRTDRDTCRGGFQTRAGATNTDREVTHLSRNSVGGGFQTCPTLQRAACLLQKRWITFALTSRIVLRRGRMALTISRERRLPREGAFQTRPYKSPAFVRRREPRPDGMPRVYGR
jgi:hypothetical protein